MKNFARLALVTTLGLALPTLAAAPSFAADQITFAVDTPEVQGSFVSGVTLETFDSGCSSPLAFGTFTGTCESWNPSFYAGAADTSGNPSTGGSGTKMAVVPMGSEMVIELNAPANYLGFHWEAGNEYDRVRLYSGDTLLANFSFETLMSALEAVSMSTQEGGTVTSEDYYGNPVTGQQQHEPYAYVHISASTGVTFDKVVISEDAGSPGMFEFDNMTVGFNADADFGDTVVLDVVTLDTPVEKEALADTGVDASGIALAALMLLATGAVVVRRRRA